MSLYLVYFYALFSLVLFRFDFILLQIYFLFESFTLNCILFYFRNEYMVEGVLEQKKEDWSKYSARIRRYGDKNMSPQSQKLGTARANMWHGCATLQDALLLLFFKPKLL
jgi:hypothetical protein